MCHAAFQQSIPLAIQHKELFLDPKKLNIIYNTCHFGHLGAYRKEKRAQSLAGVEVLGRPKSSVSL